MGSAVRPARRRTGGNSAAATSALRPTYAPWDGAHGDTRVVAVTRRLSSLNPAGTAHVRLGDRHEQACHPSPDGSQQR